MEFQYTCTDCGKEFISDSVVYLCPDCGGNRAGEFQRGVLKVLLDPGYLRSLAAKERISGEDFLPYPLPMVDTYPVGNTPLIAPWRLRDASGRKGLYLKNDGANPSGSLKDRASQLVAAQALHFGERVVILASTGNAGSAMACAGAAYGLEVILFVPETAPKAKLLQSILYGAKVLPIRGTYDVAFSLSMQYSLRMGGINRNTAFNPMTIEGKKTVSIEIFNQLGGRVPDIVFVPTGDGVILAGVYKGFSDLKTAGLAEKVPRMICVQAEGSNAITRALETGRMSPLSEVSTKADSIAVASPANGRMAVENIRSSGGKGVLVTDEEITEAQLQLCRDAGIFVEPAAAAAWAGFLKDRDTVGKDETAVVLLTGTGFKDMKSVEDRVTIPDSIEPDIDRLEKVKRNK